MHTKLWLDNLKGRDHLEQLGIDGGMMMMMMMMMTEWSLEKQGGKAWTGFIWLRIGTSGRHF